MLGLFNLSLSKQLQTSLIRNKNGITGTALLHLPDAAFTPVSHENASFYLEIC
jgi:hypothetical protein